MVWKPAFSLRELPSLIAVLQSERDYVERRIEMLQDDSSSNVLYLSRMRGRAEALNQKIEDLLNRLMEVRAGT